jgi:hypothetical protein
MHEELPARLRYATASRARYRARHTLSGFFGGLQELGHVAAAF